MRIQLWLVGGLALILMGSAQTQEKKGPPRDRDGGPSVGDTAPSFTLKTLSDEKKEITLSSFKDKKPVCLIFGSYT